MSDIALAPASLPVKDLRPAASNVRAKLADPGPMAASMREVGVLQPLAVRLDGARWVVVDGHHRLAAAKKAGLTHVPVHVVEATDARLTLAQVTANLVRVPMTATETWEAVDRLRAQGIAGASACAALGLSDRERLRLERLGQLPEAVRADLRTGAVALPPDSVLRAMVMADPATLLTAWAANRHEFAKGGYWHGLQRDITRRRYAAGAALFPLAAHPEVAWEQDLFAQDAEATTADTTPFLAAQRAEVQRRIDVLTAAGIEAQLMDPEGREWWQQPPELQVEHGAFRIGGATAQDDEDDDVADPFDVAARPELVRLFWIDVRTGVVSAHGYTRRAPSKAQAEAPAAWGAPKPAPKPPVTQRGQELIEAAQRAAVAGRFGELLASPDDRDTLLLTMGLLLAERVNVKAPTRKALCAPLLGTDESEGGFLAAFEALQAVVHKALTRQGNGAVHMLPTIRALGRALGAEPQVRWGEEELKTLKPAELEALAARLEVVAPKAATGKAWRGAILAGGAEVTLTRQALPLLDFAAVRDADWPYSLRSDYA